jgi:hypothetical protein
MFTATDNCDNNLTIVQVPAPGTILSASTNVTITATDDAGNAASCSFLVTVNDTTDPVLVNCPGNQAEDFNDDCEFIISDYISEFGISATDNCSAPGSITVTQTPAAGTPITGPITVIVEATDQNGNTISCSFDVVPADVTAPWIVGCPTNQSVSLTGACNYILPDYMDVFSMDATDNCTPYGSVFMWQDPAAGTVITSDTFVQVFALDGAGNISVCAFNVTVDDTTPPAISCPGDQLALWPTTPQW